MMHTVLAFVLVLLVSFFPLSDTGSTIRAATPPPARAASMFDSIRTNLSDYIWPTNATRLITSSFGEYRRTHFHGGIDIRTHDRTGYPVFASRDGYVERIRISPTGYGKMLYVRHADGYTTTYAHLEKFAGAIEEWARREQQRLQQSPVDIRCDPGAIRVSKGETIAFTGQTGIGAPHLHFEIRDENLNPVNPLLCPGLRIDDTIPPEIYRVEFTPLSPDGEVNFRAEPLVLKVHRINRSRGRLPEPIAVSGRVGISIDARDQSNGTYYRHGAYGHDLFLDGHILFSVRLNRVSFADDQEAGLYYDWEMEGGRSQRFERLYSPIPVRLPVVNGAPGDDGVISDLLPPGRHTLRIVSRDFNDNMSEVSATIVISRRPEVSIRRDSLGDPLVFDRSDTLSRLIVRMRKAATEDWTTRILRLPDSGILGECRLPFDLNHADIVSVVAENKLGFPSHPAYLILRAVEGRHNDMSMSHEFINDHIRVSIDSRGIFTTPPTIVVYEGGARSELTPEAIDLGHYIVSFAPNKEIAGLRRLVATGQVDGHVADAHDEFDLYPLSPGQSGTFAIDDDGLRVSFDSETVLAKVLLHVMKETDEDGIVYSLLPGSTVLKGALTVSLRDHPEWKRRGIFFRGRSGWRLLTALQPDSAGYLRSRVRGTLGEVAVFADTIPPWTSAFSVRSQHTRRPVISFRFYDDLAGIEYDSLKMYIDGVGVIPEIDGEHHRATYEAARKFEHGPHRVTIRLSDLLGNATTEERRFVVR